MKIESCNDGTFTDAQIRNKYLMHVYCLPLTMVHGIIGNALLHPPPPGFQVD